MSISRSDVLQGLGLKTGTVKWFNDKLGYGFLVDDSDGDVLVHWRRMTTSRKGRKTLLEGQVVWFVEGRGPGGSRLAEVFGLEEEL